MSTPKYLNCPFCPAQSFPTSSVFITLVKEYKCPANHTFMIQEQEGIDELRDADILGERSFVRGE